MNVISARIGPVITSSSGWNDIWAFSDQIGAQIGVLQDVVFPVYSIRVCRMSTFAYTPKLPVLAIRIAKSRVFGMPKAPLVTKKLSRFLTVCLFCLATWALVSPPPAMAVSIIQLPLPSTSAPASLVFSWPGGIIISGNSSTYAYEHVTVQPFTLTPGPSGDEIRAVT